jgi:hypothetical protein
MVGDTSDVGVADGSGVKVGVGWSKGMGRDSLQEAANSEKASAVARRNSAPPVRARP